MSLLVKGVTSFLGLTDTPAAYAGQTKKVARVNAAENALEFGGSPLGFVNIYNGALPTDFPWVYETALPWTYVTGPAFSPLIKNAVNQMETYVIDAGTNFWMYNMSTKHWTELPSPTYAASFSGRNPSPSPNGLRLACLMEESPGGKGSRRIGFYTIATGVWSYSAQAPNVAGNVGAIRSVAWKDDDEMWAWVVRDAVNHTFMCMRYVPSTDTWTAFANTFVSGYVTGRPAAINSAGTVVFGGGIGAALQNYCKYTIATDTYATAAIGAGRQWINSYDDDDIRMWYMSSTTGRFGYLLSDDESSHDNVFPENTEKTSVGWLESGFYGTTACISRAKSTEPSVMSYVGTGSWLLCSQALSSYALLLVDKPNDGYPVLATENTLARTIAFYSLLSVTVPAGTWKFYYSKDGDYTQIKIYYALLVGGP